jgi:dienelactone hydrolase
MPSITERFTSGGRTIAADVFLPAAGGRRPATLILHGTFGLLPAYRDDILSFAAALADKGIVAVLPHYFDRTGTSAGDAAAGAIAEHLSEWKDTCADALIFMRGHARVDASRLSVIGFSLGGHLALSLAMAPHPGAVLKCVVDFFGPTRLPPLGGDRSLLPPLLIHHGDADSIVPIADSIALVTDLRAAGKVEGIGYRFVTYPGAGHKFEGKDLDASRRDTVAFVAETV